jgi:glycosyltransferase involved in cell wall biosynthesis
MINVLSIVSYKFLPPDMGGQKGIAFFNRYLSRLVKLSCVTIEDNRELDTEGYPIKNILSNSKSRYFNPFYFFTISRIIRKEKITHLIIEHPYYGWLGILLKWFCKVKLIVHSHNIEALRFKSMGKWWCGILWHYEKLTHAKADHNFFIQDNDRNYAIENFKLTPGQCTTITYGFELSQPPTPADKRSARDQICKTHGISETDRILLFNGTLGYKPNLDALNNILKKINPLLLNEVDLHYKIIICGNKLPADRNGLINYKDQNIIYAGFVDDINLYFKGCDIFINPVIDGGGIKTKVVEALGNDLSVISTQSGAIGIPSEITGHKMYLVENNDWTGFSNFIKTINPAETIPIIYFDHFYWGKIAEKAAASLK